MSAAVFVPVLSLMNGVWNAINVRERLQCTRNSFSDARYSARSDASSIAKLTDMTASRRSHVCATSDDMRDCMSAISSI